MVNKPTKMGSSAAGKPAPMNRSQVPGTPQSLQQQQQQLQQPQFPSNPSPSSAANNNGNVAFASLPPGVNRGNLTAMSMPGTIPHGAQQQPQQAVGTATISPGSMMMRPGFSGGGGVAGVNNSNGFGVPLGGISGAAPVAGGFGGGIGMMVQGPALPESVLVLDGKLRVGPDGISVVNPDSPDSKDLLPPVVKLEDLVFERHLDRTAERNVSLFRRANTERKERYAVKELQTKSQRDTVYVVAAEVGSAFANRSEFTVGLRNAYLRGGTLTLIMEYMDGRSLADLLKSHHDLGEVMPERAAAFVTHRLMLALQCLHGPSTASGGDSSFATATPKSPQRDDKHDDPSAAAAAAAGGSGCGLHIRTGSSGGSSNGSSPTGGSSGAAKTSKTVHRDIKPSNILLNSRGAVKLADFGAAGNTDSIGLATFIGSTNFMSPERINGKPYGTPSDIFSAGVTAAEMLLGHHPFIGEQAKQMHEQKMETNRTALQKTVPASVATGAANSQVGEKQQQQPKKEGEQEQEQEQQRKQQQQQQQPSSPAPVAMVADAPGTKAASAAAAAHASGSGSGHTGGGGGSGGANNSLNNRSSNNRSGMSSGGGGVGTFFELFERVTKCDDFDIGSGYSDEARDFIRCCLRHDPDKRPSAGELLQHPWLVNFNKAVGGSTAAPPLLADAALAARYASTSSFLSSQGSFVFAGASAVAASTSSSNEKGAAAAFAVNDSAADADDEIREVSDDGTATAISVDPASQPQQSTVMGPLDFAQYVADVRRRAREREMAEHAQKKTRRGHKSGSSNKTAQ